MLLRFAFGKVDADVDVLSLVGRMLDSMAGRKIQPSAEKKPRDRYAPARARQRKKVGTSGAASMSMTGEDWVPRWTSGILTHRDLLDPSAARKVLEVAEELRVG